MFSTDPTYPLYPIFAFLGFILSLVPLPWHLQAWNAGTCAYMIWASVACLIGFVNALVWKDNVNNVAPVWCDISSKLLLGVGIGIPASSLCISRRLYKITAIQTVSVSRQDKIRAIVGDVCIAVGVPVLVMILHIVVQGHRFDIMENIGCYPTIYNTLPAYFLVFMWPVALGCVSFVYSAMTLRAFWKRRLQFTQFISSNTSMNISRYLRLILLACIEMLCTIPLGIYSMYIANQDVELSPYISWANVHFDFGRIGLFPALVWRSDPSFQISAELTRWLYPFCALLFFALFGFAGEAQKNYSIAFWAVAKRFGFNPPASKGIASSGKQSWKATPKGDYLHSDNSLPAYTPPSPSSAANKKRRPESLTSSLADSAMDVDLEKGHGFPSPSPSDYTTDDTPTRPHSAFSSVIDISAANSMDGRDTPQHHDIVISDAHPCSRAPTPMPTFEPYSRPFTPPSVYPIPTPHPSSHSLNNSIQVMIHTETYTQPLDVV